MAWEFVGVSTVVETVTASHTLTEPAGCQEGDLLVAIITIRTSNTGAVTLPSGWSLASGGYTNNTLANSTSGIASGLIAYIIRGASAPALGFAHPANPSVARGQIVAYRNSDPTQASVLDVTGRTVLSSGSTSINVAGITTTQDNDLIVGAVAGGRNITVTNFNNATGGTSSGTGSNVTAAPANNTWQERADAGTSTGADTGLAIFDAVKTAAGATGNITATASAAARHLVMLAAFKIDPGPAGTEYPQSASITSSAAVALSLGLVRGVVRAIASSGAVSRAVGIGKRSAVAGLAAVSRVAGVSRSIGLTSSGAVSSAKGAAKAFAVASAASVAVAASRAYLIAASIASSGAVAASKTAGKVGSIAGSGLVALRKAASRSVGISSAGSVAAQATRAFLLSLSVASAGAVSAARSVGKRVAAASSGVVSARRAIGKASAISSAASVAARKAMDKTFALASAGEASIRKVAGKMASVLPTSSVATQKAVDAQRAVSAASAVSLIKSLPVVVSVASAGVVSASKTVGTVIGFVSVALVASATEYLNTRVIEPAAKRIAATIKRVRQAAAEVRPRLAVSKAVRRAVQTVRSARSSKARKKK